MFLITFNMIFDVVMLVTLEGYDLMNDRICESTCFAMLARVYA